MLFCMILETIKKKKGGLKGEKGKRSQALEGERASKYLIKPKDLEI